jgi:hypothetical protein
LAVRAGRLLLGHPRLDRYGPLLRVREAVARFTGLAYDRRGTLTVAGTCRWSGADGVTGRARPDLLLEVGDALIRRPLVVRSTSGDRLHWTCDLPVAALPPGHHRLRVVARDDAREVALSSPAAAASGPIPLGADRAAWLRPGPDLAVATGRAAPLAWVLRRTGRRLAGAVVRRARSITA